MKKKNSESKMFHVEQNAPSALPEPPAPPLVLWYCMDCGEKFEAPGHVRARKPEYCQPCREKHHAESSKKAKERTSSEAIGPSVPKEFWLMSRGETAQALGLSVAQVRHAELMALAKLRRAKDDVLAVMNHTEWPAPIEFLRWVEGRIEGWMTVARLMSVDGLPEAEEMLEEIRDLREKVLNLSQAMEVESKMGGSHES
jgi:hypothetical protein